MVRIHDAIDTATLASSSTSGATQQDETLSQAAFDLHLHDMPCLWR
jgi:trehalose 6-phosphate synthase